MGRPKLWELARGLAVVLGVALTVWADRRWLVGLAFGVAGSDGHALERASQVTVRVVELAVAASLPVVVMDGVLTRRRWIAGLRMTRAQVEREHRDRAGPPEVRRQRDELGREQVGHDRRSLGPHRLAFTDGRAVVVVYYDDLSEESGAPVVVGRSAGRSVARRVAEARREGIRVVWDPSVTRRLRGVPLGQPIPEVVYEAVAIWLPLESLPEDVGSGSPGEDLGSDGAVTYGG